MPNRTSREADLTDQTFDCLSDGAEVLYRRLQNVADDFGRFQADSQVMKSKCYPTRPDAILPAERVAALYSELLEAGYVRNYIVDGQAYGYFAKWSQHRRAKFSKYPPPPTDVPAAASTCEQMSPEVRDARHEESRRENPLASPPAFEPAAGRKPTAWVPRPESTTAFTRKTEGNAQAIRDFVAGVEHDRHG